MSEWYPMTDEAKEMIELHERADELLAGQIAFVDQSIARLESAPEVIHRFKAAIPVLESHYRRQLVFASAINRFIKTLKK